jgi:HAD superfamily hydrolase (TIGR01459 family)
MVNTIKICEGISDISDSYGGLLIDQWGTLHNGQRPFDGVVETLENLRKRGKQIILISNSGQRIDYVAKKLNAMGIHDDLYDHIVTSTETARISMHDRTIGVLKDIGQKCYLLNRKGNTSIIDGLDGIQTVDDIEQADFILLTGSDAPEKTLNDDYIPLLKKASRHQIKMVCANPEKIMTIDGQNYFGSGEIARKYEEFGGVVTYIGKPFPSIFQYALSLFNDLYPSQICMIGDSLANDMRGARYLDMDCALIAGGIHKGSFSKVKSRDDIFKMIKILGKNYGVEPTYFIPKFHWGRALPDRKNKRKHEK